MKELKAVNYFCNPYLPSKEYVPDGEPHVFGDRIYVYGSHDVAGTDRYCAGSYVGWSCPVDDMSKWKYEGVIYEKGQDPLDKNGDKDYYAPDVVEGTDGRYYLYYSMFESYVISVAVADKPYGPFKFYGYVKDEKGHILGSEEGDAYQFDPALLKDTDGKYYLYSGQDLPIPFIDGRKVMGAMVAVLKEDMITIEGEQKVITSRNENPFEENLFFEASSIRKHNDLYYFIYSALPNIHYLCYATSIHPDRDFKYQGVLVSNANIVEKDGITSIPENGWGNNHGSILFIEDQSYIFYHRNSGKGAFTRQGCVQKLSMDENGLFIQAIMTSTGIAESLPFKGEYEAYIACGIQRKDMPAFQPYVFFETNEDDPYVTEDEEQDYAYVANMNDQSQIIFRYFEVTGNETKITVTARAKSSGNIIVKQDNVVIGQVKISETETFTAFNGNITANNGKSEIRLVCEGCQKLDVLRFSVR